MRQDNSIGGRLRTVLDELVADTNWLAGSYWQPTAPHEAAEVGAFLGTIAPGLYRKGETFEQPRYSSGW